MRRKTRGTGRRGNRTPAFSFGAFMNPQRIMVRGGQVPAHTANPVVRRVVRLTGVSVETAAVNIRSELILLQDLHDYGITITAGSPGRYNTMRVESIRAYVYGTNAVASLELLFGTEGSPSPIVTYTDSAVPGATLAAVGVRLGALAASQWIGVDVQIASLSSPGATTPFNYVIDVTVDLA